MTEVIDAHHPPRNDPPPKTPRSRDGGGSSLERVTVNLSPRSVAAMDRVVELTEDSKTDVINKSLQFWAFVQELMKSGGAVYTREADSNELERQRPF